MSTEEVRVPGLYFNIIEGNFRTRVDQSHPDAVPRQYELDGGATAIKYERVVNALKGYVEDIGLYEGNFGKVIKIKLDKNADGKHPIIEVSIEGSYGEDLLKKLPAIDFTKEVRFRPYAFTGKDEKEVIGIDVTQQNEAGEWVQIKNFFYNPDTKQNLHGFPEIQGDRDAYQKEDWKIHFLQVRKFLIQYIQANVIPELARRPKQSAVLTEAEVDAADEEPGEIPF